MKENICLIYFDHMSGEFTSILDIYLGLLEFSKKKIFKLLVLSEANKNIVQLYKSLPSDIYYSIKLNTEDHMYEHYDTVICSAFYFFGMATNRIKNFFSCEKLIILDSSSFVMGEYNNIDIFNEIEKFPCKEKYILGNNFNKRYFPNNFIHYYHKLNFKRINQYYKKNKYGIFQKKENIHPLEYSSYDYHRRINILLNPISSLYYENIGKSIFEFLYLERPVHYSIKNKNFNEDGLTNYLNLFDIDDNKNQTLRIQKQQIKDKLEFQKKDLLLKII